LKAKQELERRQGDEGKTKKIKRRKPSQEDESDRPHDLEFIQLLKPKPKFSLETILLSV
jgi:hypothetical protein